MARDFRQNQQQQSESREGSARSERAYLPGRNPIRELLVRASDRMSVVYYADRGGVSREREELLAELRLAGVRTESVPTARLDELARGAVHQSFVAELRPNEPRALSDLVRQAEAKPRSVLLFLDSIQDPHNLGAIFRAAECFAVSGIVWSRNRGASITPVARKVSVGATELVPFAQVGNLADALRKVRESGYWIVTAEVGEGSISLQDFETPDRVALVLGSEGEGVQQLVASMADYRVRVPMAGAIDSLNVSQATAVMLYALTQGGFTASVS